MGTKPFAKTAMLLAVSGSTKPAAPIYQGSS